MKDNWINKEKKRICKTCVSYIEKETIEDGNTHTIIGRCRKNAPVVGKGFPTVYPDDWCGDHKLDADKI
jgi:hypothetical protein